jgi:hypothetical protein
MSDQSALFDELNSLNRELTGLVRHVEAGQIVDISKLPGRLQHLHQQIDTADASERAALARGYEEVLSSLDTLSLLIQQRYDVLTNQIDALEHMQSGTAPYESVAGKE